MVTGIVVAALILGFAAVIIYGNMRWSANSKELVEQLSQGDGKTSPASPDSPSVYHEEEIAGLPAPVQRYFRSALTDGQPIITGLRMRQSGTFNMGRQEDQWKPFTAEQIVSPGHTGFLWDARIRMMPGLPAYVHDSYANGSGLLHGALYGVITVTEARDTPEVTRGEFLRYLAETAWYPTALLPSQGAVWEPVDDNSARVTLTDDSALDGPLSVTMLFRFNEDDRIESVHAEERGAEIDGEFVPTPWEGRWWSYEERAGMLVPTRGEVAWLFPDRRKPYWRGRITEINYEFGGKQ
jgi:hypothetical protein